VVSLVTPAGRGVTHVQHRPPAGPRDRPCGMCCARSDQHFPERYLLSWCSGPVWTGLCSAPPHPQLAMGSPAAPEPQTGEAPSRGLVKSRGPGQTPLCMTRSVGVHVT